MYKFTVIARLDGESNRLFRVEGRTAETASKKAVLDLKAEFVADGGKRAQATVYVEAVFEGWPKYLSGNLEDP